MSNALLSLLHSVQFWEKILLLIGGGVLTGFFLPWIKGRIDDRSAWRRKLLESELARQEELIASQIKLLDELSNLLWKFMFAGFRVSYAFAWEETQVRDKVAKEYGPISWELLTNIRAEVSRASRLTSVRTQMTLRGTYDWLIRLDDEISMMVEKSLDDDTWAQFHQQKFHEAGEIIDASIHALASDMKLAQPGLSGVSIGSERLAAIAPRFVAEPAQL